MEIATHCGKVGKKLVNTDMLKNFPSCYPGKLFRFSRLLEVGPQLEGSLWNWFHGQLLQNIKFHLNFPRISGSGHTQENSVKTSFHRTSWPERILLSNNPTSSSSPVRFCLLWWKASFPVWEMCQGVSDGVTKTLCFSFSLSFVTTFANSQKENIGLCFKAQDRKLGLKVFQKCRECF